MPNRDGSRHEDDLAAEARVMGGTVEITSLVDHLRAIMGDDRTHGSIDAAAARTAALVIECLIADGVINPDDHFTFAISR